MKLHELAQNKFNKYSDIDFNVSVLYRDYGEKEIYDILKQYINEPDFFSKLIVVRPSKNSRFANANNSSNFHSYEREKIEDNYYHFFYTLINNVSQREKEVLLDLAQPYPRITVLFLKNPEVQLTPEQFDRVFNGQDLFLREALISNPAIALSAEQVNQGLLESSSGLSVVYAKRHDKTVTKKTIDTLIQEDDYGHYLKEEVLIELMANPHIHFEPAQVKFFTENESFKLRLAVAKNYSIDFTEEQIIAGLNDKGFEYEAYDSTYDDYQPTDVMEAFLDNPNIRIPESEIENLIYNSSSYWVEKLMKRREINFTAEQSNHILSQNNQASVMFLTHATLGDHQLLKLLYQSPHWPDYIAKLYLSRENVTVSDVVFNVLKISDNAEIKKVLQERGEALIKDNHIQNTNKNRV